MEYSLHQQNRPKTNHLLVLLQLVNRPHCAECRHFVQLKYVFFVSFWIADEWYVYIVQPTQFAVLCAAEMLGNEAERVSGKEAERTSHWNGTCCNACTLPRIKWKPQKIPIGSTTCHSFRYFARWYVWRNVSEVNKTDYLHSRFYFDSNALLVARKTLWNRNSQQSVNYTPVVMEFTIIRSLNWMAQKASVRQDFKNNCE